ncbi:cell division cycle-associated protein 3 isoform X2 [Sphaerodactylus townsendi]|uniref:cell division cycle-associated protein 3 isoform X2 n=1 Tax=Sphaerodactylus townsendi TaxID=933632 RepID=UPI002027266E|nr:cell division cycle-associated protein 3 isoform X2 [Sphaerodactylus townsendi]
MGASESTPATPASKPLLNKHLAHVSDPRSPTAGILRTPIEVENSLQGSPQVDSKEEGSVDSQNLNLDPRSPTLGILRTPMKAVVAGINNLVKQLNEAFAATTTEVGPLPEDPSCQSQKHEGALVVEEDSREEASSGRASQKEEGRKEQLSENATVAAVPRVVANPTDVCWPAGSKPVRRRGSGKTLAILTSSGRSPLSVLQDDNSPSSFASQSKRHPSVADSQGERKEGALPSGRTLKAGSCSRGYALNKENQQCRLVEN